ncbi:MAG TPA: hypothetical protein VM912_20350, partial [Terriglobales bacterium]|nr:hypothetical protein [Terriglobales bacterium]
MSSASSRYLVIRQTVLQLHPIRLAISRKLHRIAIRQPHVPQIQNDGSVVHIKERSQLRDLLRGRAPPLSAKTMISCRTDRSILKVMACCLARQSWRCRIL